MKTYILHRFTLKALTLMHFEQSCLTEIKNVTNYSNGVTSLALVWARLGLGPLCHGPAWVLSRGPVGAWGLGFSEPEPHKALAWIPWRVAQLLGRVWLTRQGGGTRVDGQEVAPWWGTGGELALPCPLTPLLPSLSCYSSLHTPLRLLVGGFDDSGLWS